MPLALHGTPHCEPRRAGWHRDCLIFHMAEHDERKKPGKTDPRPRPENDRGDDIPDTPPDEPQPEPIRDPKPPGRPKGPYIAGTHSTLDVTLNVSRPMSAG